MIGFNPGKYRHRVDIEEPRIERDPENGAVSTKWEPLRYRYPAQVLTGPGRELASANTKLAETAARINMPWFPELTPECRILWCDMIFDITAVDLDETGRQEYRLRCKDGLTDGR